MHALDRLIFAARRVQRSRIRRKLAARGERDPVARAQSTAWPDGRRLRAPWSGERFVVIDTETTGLDPDADHAVSLGAVSVVGGRIVLGDTLSRVIAAAVDPSRHSIIMHGLTPDQVANGSGPQAVVAEFLRWVGDAVIVAHHASFDLAMLNRIAVPLCGAPIQNLVLDTAVLARRTERGRGGRYDLDSLLERYDVPQSGARHTALGDALLTARLFQKLLKRLAERGVRTLADLALPSVPIQDLPPHGRHGLAR